MSSPWADQPYSLISTQSFSKDTSHAAYYVATQMALAHNGLIRGLNAIYIQAPHIPKDAIQDFLTYCQCWCETMHHHHDGEEENFFPNIERITGVKGLMERNVQQHRAFTPGFEAFQEYADKCRVEEYEGAKVRSLIEGFAEPLSQHLHEEIDTLRALDKYDSARVRQAYKDLEKIEMAGDGYRNGPLVFGTADRSFEGGVHNFPPVPFFIPYIMHYVLERRHRGAWRFNPCTSWRERRELPYTGTRARP
ncbi:hypothetical protein M409DRAFT_25086 [Zasmidium cellare ATCC 36951]|uniref:Hemerythrin-like domain-containing protein n=1 Tax=Zasmidium cellare ATCC 36951 TaxID=1080233 RepID=A0A6A6CD85_ZASCE|nr:uncharacterized protein M409DRAFT_25086 [Zasmidium cellare ATCC 36951]KAF2164693.1 hypothetical protein M409DRAFT_25086 [Zasmidium cellare ATCC 36951]